MNHCKTELHNLTDRSFDLLGLRLRLFVRLYFIIALLVPKGYRLSSRLSVKQESDGQEVFNFEKVA